MKQKRSRKTVISASIAAIVVTAAIGMAFTQASRIQNLDNRSDASMLEQRKVNPGERDAYWKSIKYRPFATPRASVRPTPRPTIDPSIAPRPYGEVVPIAPPPGYRQPIGVVDPRCGWCGQTCTETKPGVNCPDVVPPAGALCTLSKQTGRCQIEFLGQ